MQIITDSFQKELKAHGNEQFPLLVSYEKLSKYETGSFLWHWHPEIEITLITAGEMMYHINQTTYHLRKGHVLFGNANTLHAGHMFENKDCEYISITFDPKLIYGYPNSSIYQKYVLPILQNYDLAGILFDNTLDWHLAVINSVQEIIKVSSQEVAGYELDIVIELQKIWKFIYRNLPPQADISHHTPREENRIKKIMEYISLNYQRKINLEDIANYINLSSSECSRFFKSYMKISLFSYLQEYRIEKSLAFLADKDLSIMEVAEKCGFADSNYYTKVFSRYKKCSPREYRKRY